MRSAIERFIRSLGYSKEQAVVLADWWEVEKGIPDGCIFSPINVPPLSIVERFKLSRGLIRIQEHCGVKNNEKKIRGNLTPHTMYW